MLSSFNVWFRGQCAASEAGHIANTNVGSKPLDSVNNMTTKEKLRAYYLPWLVVIGLLFGLKFLFALFDEEQRKRVTSIEGLAILFSLVIVSAILCGGVYHWFDQVNRPKRRKKLFDRINHLDLVDIGLKQDTESLQFSGLYRGYHLTVYTDSIIGDGDNIYATSPIVFKKQQEDFFIKNANKYHLSIDEDVAWLTCKTKMKFGKYPKGDKLKKDIQEFVDTLRLERIEPVVVTEV